VAATAAIGEAAKQRGLFVLLLTTFFAWAGFFLIVPLIAVHYVDQLGWTAASIGLVLGVRQFVQQGLTTGAGIMADRWGAKGLICVGMGLRAVGFGAMAFADSYPRLLLATLLAALGGALFESPRSAAVAALTTEVERPRYYSLTGFAGGLGITLGTQVGALLLRIDFALVSLAAAACYVVILFLVMVLLPPVRVAANAGHVLDGVGLALHDRRFMTYNVLMLGHWFIWTQYYNALPLAAKAITGTADAIAWVFGVNAAMTVLLGYPLPRLVMRVVRPLTALVLGVALTAAGLGAVGVATGTTSLLLAVGVFSLGTVLTRPSEQTVVADLSNPTAYGSYYGIASLSLAIGGGIGNTAGGVLYDLGVSLDRPALPWFVFAAIGLSAALGLLLTMTPATALLSRRQTAEP
jgi:DHA1 family multidrug resistance protein-like MFS transporter